MTKNIVYTLQKGIVKRKQNFKKVFLPAFTASLFALGLFTLSSVFAQQVVQWDHNGTTNGLCNTLTADPSLPAGQQQWLFVLTNPDPDDGPWSLTASFNPATTPNPITTNGEKQGGGNSSVHFTVNTTMGAQLLSASATNGDTNSVLTVSHCTYHAQLQVSKTAATSFTRDFDWTINKSVDKTDLTLAPGEQQTVNYSVVVTKDNGTDKNWSVSGVITVTNPDPKQAAAGIVVTDAISGVGSTPVSCPSTTLASGASMECIYGPVVLPDGTARTNTATATTTTVSIASGNGTANVTFGAPSTLEDNCVNVADTIASTLNANLCASQNFNYSSTIDAANLPCGNSDIVNVASLISDDGQTKTSNAIVHVNVACSQGCTLTQGYWKTHNVLFHGGAPADDAWNLLSNGPNTTFFLSGTSWFNVFWTAPAGNAYYNLADQYMAARLNVLNGADAPANVQTAISQATTLFNAYTPSQVAALKGNNATRAQFISLAGILGSYNEGQIGPGHCSE